MTNKVLNWAILGVLAIGLAVPVTAEVNKSKSNVKNNRVQGTFSDGCSISSTDDAVAIDVHLSNLWTDGSDEAIVVLTVKPAAKGKPITAGWNLKENKTARTAAATFAQLCDSAPAISAEEHAINTKGAGAERQRSNNPSVLVNGTVLTCTVSGDASNPVVDVHLVLPPPSSGKATFKEFTVTKKTDAAGRADAASEDDQNMVACSTESGAPSAVSVKASWNLKENVK